MFEKSTNAEAAQEAARSAEDLERDVKYVVALGEREERLWKMREAAMLSERRRRADERRLPGVPDGDSGGACTNGKIKLGIRSIL